MNPSNIVKVKDNWDDDEGMNRYWNDEILIELNKVKNDEFKQTLLLLIRMYNKDSEYGDMLKTKIDGMIKNIYDPRYRDGKFINPSVFYSTPPHLVGTNVNLIKVIIAEVFSNIGDVKEVIPFTEYTGAVHFVRWNNEELKQKVIKDNALGKDKDLKVFHDGIYYKFMLLLSRGQR